MKEQSISTTPNLDSDISGKVESLSWFPSLSTNKELVKLAKKVGVYMANKKCKKCDNQLKDHPDWEELSQQLGVDYLHWSDDTRLESYWLKMWCCTDTSVGTKAYFLDDEFVCISNQGCRKCQIDFSFVSLGAVKKVKKYLQSLLGEDELRINVLSHKEEYDEEYKIDYPEGLYSNINLHKKARYIKTNEIVNIVSAVDRRTFSMSKTVDIKLRSGEILSVAMDTLRFSCLI